MSDLIDRDKYRKELLVGEDYLDEGTLLTAINILDCMPAIKNVTAEWKYYRKKRIAVCTNCSFERNLDENFGNAVSCPNCGAKMKGAEP